MLRTSVCHPPPCEWAPVWEATSEVFVNLIIDELDDYTVQVISLKQKKICALQERDKLNKRNLKLGLIIPYLLIYYTELVHRTYPKTGVQKAIGLLSAPHHEERATGQEV